MLSADPLDVKRILGPRGDCRTSAGALRSHHGWQMQPQCTTLQQVSNVSSQQHESSSRSIQQTRAMSKR